MYIMKKRNLYHILVQTTQAVLFTVPALNLADAVDKVNNGEVDYEEDGFANEEIEDVYITHVEQQN